ncbi:MAG TPA: hypothetical protein VFT51_01700 [Bacillales bacterium]|nr:hypothetical protein [Bacillales bacterium]
MKRGTESELHNIITHGRVGSVNGALIFKNQKRLAFCDVYQFTSAGKKAKIKEITSYVIETYKIAHCCGGLRDGVL